MNWSRQQFNQRAVRTVLGTLLTAGFPQQSPAHALNLGINEIAQDEDPLETLSAQATKPANQRLETELLVPTYLGNDQRRFYGRGIPQKLRLIHKFALGSGQTLVNGYKTWSGAGWTGQPTIIKDQGKTYLIIGAFDHSLRKIDLETYREIWRYKFDDVIKGTSTIYLDRYASPENRIVILQGSRQGLQNRVSSPYPVPSFRAISFRTGKELWRMDIRQTHSWSRDNDSSPLMLENDQIFNVGENGIGYFISGNTHNARLKRGIKQPQVLSEVQLYTLADVKRQGGNLVAESSPARFGDLIYIAAGSGHIYGISLKTKQIVWDFWVGSDLDGTVAISKDGKLFCTVEKQYIPGYGGVLKLNPNRYGYESVEWFLPTANQRFNTWEGGVIGSVALNDEYRTEEKPALFATLALDGHLYMGAQHITTGKKTKGPWRSRDYDMPLIVFKKLIGASISTPIFTDGDRLVAAGYNGVYLFQLKYQRVSTRTALVNSRGEFYQVSVQEIGHFKPGSSFESTPVVWNGLIRICGRDGWLYTLG
ncbi:MAG: hypothetical protein VKJ46_03995 [Leptolyngbyaceae bacterium]|nr:hypothetical protein [Leptolyngbyaceae bacterium]